MGYCLDQLAQEEVDEELKCYVCCGLLKDPLLMSKCEHIFCAVCIQKRILKELTCPIDGQVISRDTIKSAPLILKKILSKVKLKCGYFKYGCKAILTDGNISQHEENCEYDPQKMILCNQNCGMMLTESQLLQHNCIQQYLLIVLDSQKKAIDELKSQVMKIEERLDNEIKSLEEVVYLLKREFSGLKEEEVPLSELFNFDTSSMKRKALIKYNDKTLLLDLDLKEKIGTIKEKLNNLENVNPEDLCMFFANKELDDNKCLLDYRNYRISNSIILFAVKKQIKICVRINRDKEVVLDVLWKDKVGEVLARILKMEIKEAAIIRSPDEFVLCYRNQQLDNDRTVASYKIRDGNYVFLNSLKEFYERQASIVDKTF